MVDAFGVALKPRCRQFNRCGSPALAARHSRFAQEGRQLCHLAVKQGRQTEESARSSAPALDDEPLELRPTAPPKPGGARVAAGRAMALLQAAAPEEKARTEVPSSKFATAPGKISPEAEEAALVRTAPDVLQLASVVHEPSSGSEAKTCFGSPPRGSECGWELHVPEPEAKASTRSEEWPNLCRQSSAPAAPAAPAVIAAPATPVERVEKATKVTSPNTLPDVAGAVAAASRGRHLKVDDVRPLPKSTSPVCRSPRKAVVTGGNTVAAPVFPSLGTPQSKEETMWAEEVPLPVPVLPLPDRIAWTWTSRFAHIAAALTQRGRSLTPPRRQAPGDSWRPEHLPVECLIRCRRKKKGPKEKLLVLPCLANLDDPRFQHLFETLEAEQPDLMSESMLHLQGCGRVN